jgi:hypothetical protein
MSILRARTQPAKDDPLHAPSDLGNEDLGRLECDISMYNEFRCIGSHIADSETETGRPLSACATSSHLGDGRLATYTGGSPSIPVQNRHS